MATEAPTETGARLREVHRDRQKESWKEDLQEIERKRTELLPGAPEDAEKSLRSCRVCRTRGGITSRTLVTVKKKYRCSVMK